MKVFLRRWRIPQPYRAWIDDLVAEQQGRGYRWYAFDKKDSEASRRILEASQEEERGFVLAAAVWLDLRHGKQSAAFYETWAVRQTMLSVLRRRLPFDHDEVCRLLTVVCWFKRTGSITLQEGPVYGRISRIEEAFIDRSWTTYPTS